jgi:MSHA pilin protein MshC
MSDREKGFTLIELISIMILISILSVVLFSRLGATTTAVVLGSRDDIIAAFSLAQQTAMMRSNVTLVITTTSISVNENGNPIVGSSYPLNMPSGVNLAPAPATFSFDKLGRTTSNTITVTGSGASAQIAVQSSGYAYAN